MGIYIKGMEMPKDCPVCPLAYWNAGGGFTGCTITCRYFSEELMETNSPPDFCPLIPVPDHWDLVDRSPLEVLSWKKDEVEDSFDAGVMFVCDKLDALPVVIPAEGEDYT